MRAVLSLAVCFMFAGAVEAQEVPQSAAQVETAEQVRSIEAYQPKPALEPAPRLQPTTIQTTADVDGANASQRQLETRAADAPAVMRQAPGMTWWWLVAAIVVGGLIIVAIT
jgi:uncharacterized caspase-like protein